VHFVGLICNNYDPGLES